MKDFSKLTIEDFKEFPIWTWADDENEDLVISITDEIQPEDHDSIFVLSDFNFKDGSNRQGYIGIRNYDRQVYILALADDIGDFIQIPLQPKLRNLFDSEKFEVTFEKKMNEIFPIKYSSIFLPFWDTKFEGQVDNIFTR
jgi:hypothetical protein